MSDNNLRVVFDFKAPDEPTLVVYKYFGGGYILGSEPSISVVKTFVGKEALELYSKLSGKTVNYIKKEAGFDEETKD